MKIGFTFAGPCGPPCVYWTLMPRAMLPTWQRTIVHELDIGGIVFSDRAQLGFGKIGIDPEESASIRLVSFFPNRALSLPAQANLLDINNRAAT